MSNCMVQTFVGSSMPYSGCSLDLLWNHIGLEVAFFDLNSDVTYLAGMIAWEPVDPNAGASVLQCV